jgi:acyl-CoA thioesterase FadM
VSCVPVPEGRASIRFRQEISRVANGEATTLLAEGEVRVVCVDAKSFRRGPCRISSNPRASIPKVTDGQ